MTTEAEVSMGFAGFRGMKLAKWIVRTHIGFHHLDGDPTLIAIVTHMIFAQEAVTTSQEDTMLVGAHLN